MSRKPPTPLFTPTQAAALLDQVIYEQVLECIDLDALHRLERSLTMMVGEIDGVSDDHVGDTATAILDRALHRLPNDVRCYLQAASWSPFEDCDLGDEEQQSGSQVPQQPAPVRLKS